MEDPSPWKSDLASEDFFCGATNDADISGDIEFAADHCCNNRGAGVGRTDVIVPACMARKLSRSLATRRCSVAETR